MGFIQEVQQAACSAIRSVFQVQLEPHELQVSPTKPEFTGDFTLVVFTLTRFSKTSPETTAKLLGDRLMVDHAHLFSGFGVIRGFLNLTLSDPFLHQYLEDHYNRTAGAIREKNGRTVMVEFSSPNTNKPLHLGHLRNNFLGDAICEILQAGGWNVVRANLINDRGIHICKSMVAWQLFAGGATPETEKLKGDHFVGRYYVLFNDKYKLEVAELVNGGMEPGIAEREAPLMKATQQMLQQWEAGDPAIRSLWQKMNAWVYTGFEETYRRLSIHFDQVYYESSTYLLGRELVLEGLGGGIFFRKEDGSVWVDLTGDGLDQKLLIRGDGTSVYMTQDLGTAQLKYDDFHMDKSIYVIADEQNYHMKVLQLILTKLGKPYAAHLFHLSYGMVELTSGKMKSREGTVVDADDLIDEMISTAAERTASLGKVKDFSETELQELHDILGIGAMKFFLLRVNPRKRMVFEPEESIDFQGFTGPFIQYTYARIKSILRKEGITGTVPGPAGNNAAEPMLPAEKSLLLNLEQFPAMLDEAGEEMDPSVIAVYLYRVARSFNTLYTELPISRAASPEKKTLRLRISVLTADIIARGMSLLCIRVPERM